MLNESGREVPNTFTCLVILGSLHPLPLSPSHSSQPFTLALAFCCTLPFPSFPPRTNCRAPHLPPPPPPPGVPQDHGGQRGAVRQHLHREEEDPQGGQAHGGYWQGPAGGGGGVAQLEG